MPANPDAGEEFPPRCAGRHLAIDKAAGKHRRPNETARIRRLSFGKSDWLGHVIMTFGSSHGRIPQWSERPTDPNIEDDLQSDSLL